MSGPLTGALPKYSRSYQAIHYLTIIIILFSNHIFKDHLVHTMFCEREGPPQDSDSAKIYCISWKARLTRESARI